MLISPFSKTVSQQLYKFVNFISQFPSGVNHIFQKSLYTIYKVFPRADFLREKKTLIATRCCYFLPVHVTQKWTQETKKIKQSHFIFSFSIPLSCSYPHMVVSFVFVYKMSSLMLKSGCSLSPYFWNLNSFCVCVW